VLGIISGILVARHLKTTDDLFDSKGSPPEQNQWLRLPCSGLNGSCERWTV